MRTMVVGATGIDAYIMVVAAADGVMPQTIEHAEVLRALAIHDGVARVGGGALPLLELTGPAVALHDPAGDPACLGAALRAGNPPLIPRVAHGPVLVDPRTLAEEELTLAIGVIRRAVT